MPFGFESLYKIREVSSVFLLYLCQDIIKTKPACIGQLQSYYLLYVHRAITAYLQHSSSNDYYHVRTGGNRLERGQKPLRMNTRPPLPLRCALYEATTALFRVPVMLQPFRHATSFVCRKCPGRDWHSIRNAVGASTSMLSLYLRLCDMFCLHQHWSAAPAWEHCPAEQLSKQTHLLLQPRRPEDVQMCTCKCLQVAAVKRGHAEAQPM